MECAGHGGGLVVATEAALSQLDIKYPVQGLDLGDEAIRFWRACTLATSHEQGPLRPWHLARTRLLRIAEVIGDMANVDGCVVLNGSMRVLGFGAKILTSEAEVSASQIMFSRVRSGEPWEDQSGRDLGGTRHQSAFRFVMANPLCSAYIISQDGDLTLFNSDEGRAVCLRGLAPGPLGPVG
jgi:hypothetical protein